VKEEEGEKNKNGGGEKGRRELVGKRSWQPPFLIPLIFLPKKLKYS